MTTQFARTIHRSPARLTGLALAGLLAGCGADAGIPASALTDPVGA